MTKLFYMVNLTVLRLEGEMEKKYHHGDLKTELIRAGLQMIQESGMEKVSLRKLAARCSVSEAAPYSHFKNKEELLTSIQEYVTQQLQKCLKDAFLHTPNQESPEVILNIGKAYVLFFIRYPEYYTFLFAQPCAKIDLSMKSDENDFLPFRYFKEKACAIYRKNGLSEERIKYGIIAMWAKVHGIAAIASMPYVQKDFEWEEVLEQILVE